MAASAANSITDETIAASLARVGWTCVDGFLATDAWQALATECSILRESGAMAPASVGLARVHDPALRGDATHWLGAGTSAAQDALLARLDSLRATLNRTAFLGLADAEAHFAHYPPGARYARHRDRFRDDDRRVVSLACYLNDRWDGARDGGALRLYDADGEPHDFAPLGGRAVVFLSELEHEVLPAMRDRFSVAAWLRRR
jgi:SM-20-related protein